jgi:hypothetical protein
MPLDKHSPFLNNSTDIDAWLNNMKISHYVINEDLTVDVEGDVYLKNQNLSFIPIQFGAVKGNFIVSNNCLTSLDGSPSYVEGDFFCDDNKLTSLKGGPSYVGGHYHCGMNKILNLKDIADINGNLYCFDNLINDLSSLKKVRHLLNCTDNLLHYLEYDTFKHLEANYVCLSLHNEQIQELKQHNILVNIEGGAEYKFHVRVEFKPFIVYLEKKKIDMALNHDMSINHKKVKL